MGNSGGIIGGVGVGIIGGLQLKLWAEREQRKERQDNEDEYEDEHIQAGSLMSY